jgi:hypothetical protein
MQVDKITLYPMEDKIHECTTSHHCSFIKEFFKPISDVCNCELFLSLLKYRSLNMDKSKLGMKIVKNRIK